MISLFFFLLFSFFSLLKNAFSPLDIDGYGGEPVIPWDWTAVREAFLRFFVFLFKDYKQFLIYPTEDDPYPALTFNKEVTFSEKKIFSEIFFSGLSLFFLFLMMILYWCLFLLFAWLTFI